MVGLTFAVLEVVVLGLVVVALGLGLVQLRVSCWHISWP